MGETTAIAWCDHTFNPWWGCTKVSPGCEHCYAEAWAKRTGSVAWGPGQPRRVFGAKHWAEPLAWDRAAARAGVRRRVFCASMADVCDPEAPRDELRKLFDLIEATPHLDWLLLSKRPERFIEIFPLHWNCEAWRNVWLGTTVEDQIRADQRIPALLRVEAPVRFLSCEPLLGPVNLSPYADLVDWVIAGGESGAGARACDVAWLRDLVAQCRAAGAAPFVKQLGALSIGGNLMQLTDRKGGDPAEWPADLRVQQFPEVPRG